MTLTPQWLDELRARTTLSSLIGKSVKVTRAGREYKACCPFHNEKTPSFTINDDKGFYHCLAAETRVITRDGRRDIASLAGRQATVLTRGGTWVTAQFDNYGVQRLWRIDLSRNGLAKTIWATEGHRWFVKGRRSDIRTDQIRPGHALESVVPEHRNGWELDPEGVRHGIVFGDGTMFKGVYGTVNLHSKKDAELAHWFPEQQHHTHWRDKGQHYIRIYGGRAFEGFKSIPSIEQPDAYLLGFLAGYLAADGHVAKDGTVMLNAADPDVLEQIRDIALKLGVATYGRTTLMRKGFGSDPSALHRIHFVPSSMDPDLFLLSQAKARFAAHTKRFDRLRWVVRSVAPSDRVEPVFCASVPESHAFALDDNILTGNCFGCGAHGDAIRWMTDHRGLPFMDAVKELAAAAGMDVPAPDPRAAERAEKQHSLRDVVETADRWFQEQLWSDEGAGARAYLERRGLSPDTARAFGIGLAPDARTRMRELLSRYGDAMAVEAGMLIRVDDKDPYDRFRGRLMIPIRDTRGRTIAFGGRVLGEGEPKYLNSPDTPLFDKGRVLFNLDRAAPAARMAGRLFVVEGYMDVIALAQAGIAEAVAPLGTALTETQIELAWRQVPVPIVALDGDAAGQRAAMRAAMRALPMLKPGYSLSFLTLPAGQDPDDVVRSGGRSAFDTLADAAQPLVDFLWAAALAEQRDATPEARAAVQARLNSWADSIADRSVSALYRQEFRDRVSARFFSPRPSPAAGNRPRGGTQRGRPAPEAPPSPRLRSIGSAIDTAMASAVLGGLLRYPDMVTPHIDAICQLAIGDMALARLRDAIVHHAAGASGVDKAGLMAILADDPVYNSAERVCGPASVRFTFSRDVADDAPDGDLARSKARSDLAEVLSTMIAWPGVERDLERATADFRERMDAQSFAEQQRLLALRGELSARLAALSEGDS